MTYYTIPYKTDGSCCPVCQPDPSTCSCDEDQWFCLRTTFFNAPDCNDTPSISSDGCWQVTQAFVDTLPACVNGFDGAPSAYVEFVSGPYTDESTCVSRCPQWYCVREDLYETEDCTGDVTSTYYYCAQLQPAEVATYPFCLQIGLGQSVYLRIISGPHPDQITCSAECGVCCNPAVKYGPGSKITGTAKYWIYAPGGAGSYAEVTYDCTWTAGSSFTGTQTTKLTTYTGGAGMGCYLHGDPTVQPDQSGPVTLTWACDPGTLTYYCPELVSLAEALAAQQPNCGKPLGCSGNVIQACTASYAASCCGLSYSYQNCSEFFVFGGDCAPGPTIIDSNKKQVSLGVSCLT